MPTPSPDPRPTPPQAPGDFDCCNNDCEDSCVWTIYRAAQARYERELEAWQLRQLKR
jgi:hypothetical protein